MYLLIETLGGGSHILRTGERKVPFEFLSLAGPDLGGTGHAEKAVWVKFPDGFFLFRPVQVLFQYYLGTKKKKEIIKSHHHEEPLRHSLTVIATRGAGFCLSKYKREIENENGTKKEGTKTPIF